MDVLPLEHLIRSVASLDATPNARGFWPVLCKVCNDHGRKGKRAGFAFTGNTVGFNCFNCGHTAKFNSDRDCVMPRDMVTVLRAWGLSADDWIRCINVNAIGYINARHDSSDQTRSLRLIPSTIALPDHFYPLRDDPSDDQSVIALDYLSKRRIDWTQHSFMLSTGTSTSDPFAKRWHGRLIIPITFNGRLVFWQGRDMLGIRQKKYLSPAVPRDAIMGGFDQLFKHTDDPLIVVEGWFDGEVVDGVSVMCNKMTPEQLEWLERSPRPKIIVPDKEDSGAVLARQAISKGWKISTPDIGSCKDLNEAVCKYGPLYVLDSIASSVSDGFDAQIMLDLYSR